MNAVILRDPMQDGTSIQFFSCRKLQKIIGKINRNVFPVVDPDRA